MGRISHDTYATVFSVVCLGLVGNLLLALGALPFLAVLLTADPAVSWPLLALLSPFAATSAAALFGVFAAYSADPSVGLVRTYRAAYAATWRRAGALGAAGAGALVVLGVDVRWAWGGPVAVAAIPALAVLAVLVVATCLLGLAAIAEVPAARLRDVVRAAAFLSVRRWYLTAVSLVSLGVLVAFLAARPALAIGLAAAPLLYVAWANSRYSLRPVLPEEAVPTT